MTTLFNYLLEGSIISALALRLLHCVSFQTYIFWMEQGISFGFLRIGIDTSFAFI
jgi:hypothetical protein